MKLFVFLVCLVLFVGSFLLFGYAFAVPEPLNVILFASGIAAVSASLMIPFHLVEKFD